MGRDHPRACGEKDLFIDLVADDGGSPPHVRGKACGVPLLCQHLGITPACAGKSCRPCHTRWCGLDHPRVCGEKFSNASVVWSRTGSPPRMRGKDVRQELQHSGRGITPAYAGKSAGRAATPTRCRDHPRACGEKCPPGKFFFMTVGSPPRVRGKVPSSI